MQDIRRHLAPQDPEGVLHEIAAGLLEEEGQSIPDWDVIGPVIAKEIDQQGTQLLSEAQHVYRKYDGLRARAADRRGRVDPVMGMLVSGGIAYITLVVAGLYFLSTAAISSWPVRLTLLFLAVILIGLMVGWLLWWRKRKALLVEVLNAYEAWTVMLRNQVLRPFILEKLNNETLNPRLFYLTTSLESTPRLIEEEQPLRLVETEMIAQIRTITRNIHSGSLGVSGPRGSSTILQWFNTDTNEYRGSDLRVVVSAPVDYESRDFFIHLFTRLCEAVPHGPANVSPIAVETRHHLEQLRYLHTYGSNRSVSSSPKFFGSFTWGSSQERAEQPVPLPELIERFRRYSGQVASWRGSVRGGGRVVIGIDEVDKMRDGDRAEAFLKDIQAVFGVPGCLYLVSLSEDGMIDFARRTPSIWSSFDSAFDTLVLVKPMAYHHSEQVLFKRVTGMPRPFIALCHVLAGGLPRDLIRTVRTLVDMTIPGQERTLSDTTRDLISRDLESFRNSSVRRYALNIDVSSLLAMLHYPEWTGVTATDLTKAARKVAGMAQHAESDITRTFCRDLVVSLSFYVTVLEVFASGKPGQDRLISCLKKQDYAFIDDLAVARYAMRANTGTAHHLLETYRLRHGISPLRECESSP